MYIFLTVFLILLFLILTFLVFALRILVLAHEISCAFDTSGADLITKIRMDYYTAVTETDSDSIDADINLPAGILYRRELLDTFTDNLADSLLCAAAGSPSWTLTKSGADSTNIYRISGFSIDYSGSTGTIRAELRIPVLLYNRRLTDYVKELEYSFSFSYKQQ